jgi:hypothetical protein
MLKNRARLWSRPLFLEVVRRIFVVGRICRKTIRGRVRFVLSIISIQKNNKDMKKIIVSLLLWMLVFTGSTFAGTGGVPASVSSVFNEKFANAKDVIWETGKNFYKAAFEMRGKTVFVFFANNGDIMGIAGNLSPARLPEGLRSEIKKNYSTYWITDLFNYRNADEEGFVVTLEGADKVIVLKALGDQGWRVYKTIAK